MSDRLESSYRRWLRAYPQSYRAEREDEIVGVLLDGAHSGQRRATPAEASDLLRSGLRQRFGIDSSPPRTTSWSDALAALATFVVALRVAGVISARLIFPFVHPAGLRSDLFAWNPSAVVGSIASIAVLIAAGLIVAGRSRAAGWCVAASTALGLLSTYVAVLSVGPMTSLWSTVTISFGSTMFGILAAAILVFGGDGHRGLEIWGPRNLVLAVGFWAVTSTGVSWSAFAALQRPDIALPLLSVAPVLVAAAAMWPHARRRTDGRALAHVLVPAAGLYVVGQWIDVELGLALHLWPNLVDALAVVALVIGTRLLLRPHRTERPGVEQEPSTQPIG